jgi:hypothetical protein
MFRREVFGVFEQEIYFEAWKGLVIKKAATEVIPHWEHFLFLRCTSMNRAGVAVSENYFCNLNNLLLLTNRFTSRS